MEVQLKSDEQRLYSRLYVSQVDLSSARYCLDFIMKKGWHFAAGEKRGSIYEQQTAFTTSFIVAYSRPFNTSRGWPKFPHALMPFDQTESNLHKDIINRRNSIFAHSDSKNYSVRPWRAGVLATDILSVPIFRITADEGKALRKMIGKLQLSISVKLKEMVPE
jgi:hypothetical protein